jgi:hypothetical protein
MYTTSGLPSRTSLSRTKRSGPLRSNEHHQDGQCHPQVIDEEQTSARLRRRKAVYRALPPIQTLACPDFGSTDADGFGSGGFGPARPTLPAHRADGPWQTARVSKRASQEELDLRVRTAQLVSTQLASAAYTAGSNRNRTLFRSLTLVEARINQ